MLKHNPLRILGLSKKEEMVLYALLDGFHTPLSITDKTRVSRPSVYDILNKLRQRGLVTSRIYRGKKRWDLVNNNELAILLNEAKQIFLRFQSDYEEIYHTRDSKVSFYKGKVSLREKLLQIFSEHKNEKWIGLQGQHDLMGWSSIMNEGDTKKINAMIKKNKLLLHGVLPEGWVDNAFQKLGKVWAKEYSGRTANIHYLDKNYFNHAGQIYIFRDTIYLLSLNQRMLIEIRENEIAQAISSLIYFAIDNSDAFDINKRVSEFLEKGTEYYP